MPLLVAAVKVEEMEVEMEVVKVEEMEGEMEVVKVAVAEGLAVAQRVRGVTPAAQIRSQLLQ